MTTFTPGYETCPWDLAAMYQLHITSDVSYSIRQYLYDTKDQQFLEEDNRLLLQLAREIADFWESRSEWSEAHQAYIINGRLAGEARRHVLCTSTGNFQVV